MGQQGYGKGEQSRAVWEGQAQATWDLCPGVLWAVHSLSKEQGCRRGEEWAVTLHPKPQCGLHTLGNHFTSLCLGIGYWAGPLPTSDVQCHQMAAGFSSGTGQWAGMHPLGGPLWLSSRLR